MPSTIDPERLGGSEMFGALESAALIAAAATGQVRRLAAGGRPFELQNRMGDLTGERVEQRIARALVRLANQAGQRAAEGLEINFPVIPVRAWPKCPERP